MAFRSSAHGSADATTVVVNLPAGVVDGDVLLTFVSGRWVNLTGVPAGWTQLGADVPINTAAGGLAGHLRCYWKVASGEPASYTWTFSNTQTMVAAVVALSGRSAVQPTAIAGAGTGASQQTINAPSVTAAAGDDLVCCAANGDVTTFTPPAGMTEREDFNLGTGGGMTETVATLDNVAAGATGAKTFTEALGSGWNQGAGFTVSVPAAAAPPAAARRRTLLGVGV